MWFKRMIDYSDKACRSNTGVSSLSWMVVFVGWLVVLTLLCINFLMIMEMIVNHTIVSSVEGYASIITALAGLAAAVGVPKAINNYGENKFRNQYYPGEDKPSHNEEEDG